MLKTIQPEIIEHEIRSFILNKVKSMKKNGVIIGISGGVDSFVTGCLAHRALANTSYEAFGAILPGGNEQPHKEDTDDADLFVNTIGMPYFYKELTHIIDSTRTCCELSLCHQNDIIKNPIYLKKIMFGNMASRIRANVLSTLAEAHNLLICGTGNCDEDFGIGYYTLFGDGAVHMSPIGNLSKRLVYQMASYLGANELCPNVLIKAPSARLEPNQTDYNDLGYEYKLVEFIMECIVQNIHIPSAIHQYKDLLSFESTKFNDIHSAVEDILIRHETAKKKVQLISPDVAEISFQYLPIENIYQ
jgi:NAD+ synthase